MRAVVTRSLEVIAALLTLAALWAFAIAVGACSRPPPPHPETVAPAADDDPAVCHGPDCELPKPKR